VDFVEQKYPDALLFPQDFAHAADAARVNLPTVTQELKDLTQAVSDLETEIATVSKIELPPGDRFITVMTARPRPPPPPS
jgi:hypothetical protein